MPHKVYVPLLVFSILLTITACSNQPSPVSSSAVTSATGAPDSTAGKAAPASTGGKATPAPVAGKAAEKVTPAPTYASKVIEGEVIDSDPKVYHGGIEIPPGTGALELRITSRSTEGLSAILLTISNIEVQEADSGEEDGWVSLLQDPLLAICRSVQEPELICSTDAKTVDLIAVSSGEKVLGFNVLPVGKYSQIRMAVDSVDVTSQPAGGSLTTKSAALADANLKLSRKVTIKESAKVMLTLDFDAAKSLVATDGGNFRFEPVFRPKGRSQDLKAPGPG